MVHNKTKTIVMAAFFIALDIIITRFVSFEVAFPMGPVRFDFQIIVAALCGYALGPWWGAICLASADLLGVMLNSGSLGIFLGFTLSAAMRGLLFGLLLHKREISVPWLLISIAGVFAVTDIFMSTLWLSIMMSADYLPLLVTRLLPKGILLAVEMMGGSVMIKLFAVVNRRSERRRI